MTVLEAFIGARRYMLASFVSIPTYSMDIPRQHRLFRAVLDEVAPREALINLELEIFEDADGGLELVEYEIPAA
ncbi:hypothetical protein [Burkholderia sp. BCC0397]|uniref:hypothetical protein n=1 Tax=Burkholderia sp. BCC0397 TaxID=486876 RepID=UPI001FC80E34|nr:hypothetical protein [Burkholderia sp. BCC0397]